ncbi:MAG TPA: hypothetical protein ENI87_08810 [bacterium]|nr:hypothetical protein [bacterium]
MNRVGATPPGPRSARVAAWCCWLLVLLLPTLVAGASIGADADAGERARLARILDGRHHPAQVDSQISRLFHSAAVPTRTWPVRRREQQALVVAARRSQVLGVTAVAWLLYLSVLLARGRLQALFACGLFAVLPPVAASGHVLRPQTPATLFVLLAVVLLQVAMRPAPARRRRSPRRSGVSTYGLLLCAALAIALSVETMPSLGVALLVPGVVLLIGSAQLLLRTVRCLRRRGLAGTPVRAVNQRILPWTSVAVAAPAFTVWLLANALTVPVEQIAITERTSALLPTGTFLSPILAGLLLVGALVFVLRVGLRLGRGGRIGPELVLFAFCTLLLLDAALGDGRADPFPRAPAVAVVLGEGGAAVVALAFGVLSRRRRR